MKKMYDYVCDRCRRGLGRTYDYELVPYGKNPEKYLNIRMPFALQENGENWVRHRSKNGHVHLDFCDEKCKIVFYKGKKHYRRYGSMEKSKVLSFIYKAVDFLKPFFVLPLLVGALIPSPHAIGSEFKIITLDSLYVDAAHFTWAREPFLAPTYKPTGRLDLKADLSLVNDILFTSLMVHSEMDKYQYRLVGLNYRSGINLGDYLQVYFEHFSQHLLDYNPNEAQTFDAIGVRIYLYKRGE